MDDLEILVVGETPSLGRSIADLMLTENIRTRYIPDLQQAAPLGHLASRHAIVVAASNSSYSATGRIWLQGAIPGVSLVVVGSRDPKLDRDSRIHRVDLPLSPRVLVELIRELIARSRRVSMRGRRAAAGEHGARSGPSKRVARAR